jgi:hypothetical protein
MDRKRNRRDWPTKIAFPPLPTNPISWAFTVLHFALMSVMWFGCFVLPLRVMVVLFLLMMAQFLVFGECLIAWLEKISEHPMYVQRSDTCFTYLYSVPAAVLGIDFYAVRRAATCITTTAIIVTAATCLLSPAHDGIARLQLKTRMGMMFVISLITCLTAMHIQAGDLCVA